MPAPRAAAPTCGSPRSACSPGSTATRWPALAQLQAGAHPRPPDRAGRERADRVRGRLLRDGAAPADLPALLRDALRSPAHGLPRRLARRPVAARPAPTSPEEFIAARLGRVPGERWTGSTRRWPRPTATATRAGPPAPAGSPRRPWPPRCSASLLFPDDPVARAAPGRRHLRRLRLDRLPGRRVRSAPRSAWPPGRRRRPRERRRRGDYAAPRLRGSGAAPGTDLALAEGAAVAAARPVSVGVRGGPVAEAAVAAAACCCGPGYWGRAATARLRRRPGR